MNIDNDTNIDMNNETNMNKAEEQKNQRKLLGKGGKEQSAEERIGWFNFGRDTD